MRCPRWLWPILKRWYWPAEFCRPEIERAIYTLSQMDADSANKLSPIFITSCGWRSGSTLLQRLLNSSPEVMVFGEAYDNAFLLPHLALTLSVFAATEAIDFDFLPMPCSPEFRALCATLQKGWTANITPPVSYLKCAHLASFEVLFGEVAKAAGRPRWGVKMVRATAVVAKYLRWLYPAAKIIFLYRDPYSAFRSYKECTTDGWYLYYPSHRVTNSLSFAVHWRHCMESFARVRGEVQFFAISYEELTAGRRGISELQDYVEATLDQRVLDEHVDIEKQTKCLPSKLERATIKFITAGTYHIGRASTAGVSARNGFLD